jgi:SAM-dependent methyltransferase
MAADVHSSGRARHIDLTPLLLYYVFMSSENIYEGSPQLDVERERLRSFDMPTQVSLEAIGQIRPNDVILDIGAGENPGLRDYTQANGAQYIAFDIRKEPLLEHVAHGPAIQGDLRNLPFKEGVTDVTHARFVLAHFPDKASRQQVVSDALTTVKPGGKAVFIDYDWTALNGSPVMQALRDFTVDNIKLFDASFGSYSLQEIHEAAGQQARVNELRTKSPLLNDYRPALALRQVTLAGLKRQGADEAVISQASGIFDALESEAVSHNPPGFYMPDMVAIVVAKPA